MSDPTAEQISAWLENLVPAATPFVLRRNEDVTGVSGTGIVADGAWFPAAGNSKAVVRWRGERGSTVVWDNIQHVREIHGHDGRTTVEFTPVGDLIAALKAVMAIAKSPGSPSTVSSFQRGQDDGWDQALDEVRRAISDAICDLHDHDEP